jgi:hypothetical protein
MLYLHETHWTFSAPGATLDYRHHKGLFMSHKNVLNSPGSASPRQIPESPESPESFQPPALTARLTLVPSGGAAISKKSSSPLFDLVSIAAPRCSSFLAEAAVLVLVLALLDRFMLKGRMELNWIISAFTISLILLAVSVLTEFSSRRWLLHH